MAKERIVGMQKQGFGEKTVGDLFAGLLFGDKYKIVRGKPSKVAEWVPGPLKELFGIRDVVSPKQLEVRGHTAEEAAASSESLIVQFLNRTD